MPLPLTSDCRKIPLTCRIGFAGLLFLLGFQITGQFAPQDPFFWAHTTILAVSIALLLYGRFRPFQRQAQSEDCTDPSADIGAGLPDTLWQIDYASRTVSALNQATVGNHPNPSAEDCRLASLFPARVSRLYLEALIKLQSQNQPHTLEYLLGSPDGEQYHFEARLLPLNEKSCLAVIREINAIKETEEALLNQQIFLQQIIDTSPCLIFVRDRHGRFLLVNRETQATLGHDLLVQSHLDLHGEHLPLTAGDAEALERGEPVRLMDSWIDSKGQTHWFDMTKLPILRGNETYILTSAIDISHLKAAEPALVDNGNLIRALASALPLAFLLVSRQKIQFANTAACERLGLDAASLIDQSIDTLFLNWAELQNTGSGMLQRAHPEAAILNARIIPIACSEEEVALLTLA